MRATLQQPTVLLLNRNWQATHVKTPAEAFRMMASASAAGLEIADGCFTPAAWSAWLRLPVREGDHGIGTAESISREALTRPRRRRRHGAPSRYAGAAQASSPVTPAPGTTKKSNCNSHRFLLEISREEKQ